MTKQQIEAELAKFPEGRGSNWSQGAYYALLWVIGDYHIAPSDTLRGEGRSSERKEAIK